MSINDVYIQLIRHSVNMNNYHIQMSYGSLSMTFKVPVSRKLMKHNKSLLHKKYGDSNIFPVKKAPKELLDMFYKSVDEGTITALVQLTLRHSDTRYRELCRYALNLIEEGMK